jgi:HK97 family phage major capsid protein
VIDLKTKETELATMVNNAKTMYAELEAKGAANVTGEDRQKLDKLIEDGKIKRAELDSLKTLNESIERVEGKAEGERKVNDAIDLISGRSGGSFRAKSWGRQVIESEAVKIAQLTRDLPRVDVGDIKALNSSTTTQGGVLLDNDFRPEVLDIARQRPLSVIELINRVADQ